MPRRGCAYSPRRECVDALRRRRARHAERTGRGAWTGRAAVCSHGHPDATSHASTCAGAHMDGACPGRLGRLGAGRLTGPQTGRGHDPHPDVLRRANNRSAAMDYLPHGGTVYTITVRAFWKCMIINDWCDAARSRLNLT